MSAPDKIDVLAVMANPYGQCHNWGTGDVATRVRQSGRPVSTARVLTALRREERAGNVMCLGELAGLPGWHGNNITARAELRWRLADSYAMAHGNEACRAELNKAAQP